MRTNIPAEASTTVPFKITETPQLVSARSALSTAQVRVRKCVERRDTKQGHIHRLVAQGSALAAARSALADFDSAHALRVEEWVENGYNGESPEPDRKARDNLQKALEDGEANQRCYDDVRARLSGELVTLNEELRALRDEENRARMVVVSAVGDAVAAELRVRADEAHRLAVLVTSWRNYALFALSDVDLKRIANAAYLSATDHTKRENAAARLVLANVQSVSLAGDDLREFHQMESAWEVLFDLLATNASAKLFDVPKQEDAKAA